MPFHVNIPVFIPHLGCPNMCVFCNQRAISGVCSFIPDEVRATIDRTLATVDARNTVCEIAFFGGSFTGIDCSLMIELLDIAEEYVKAGKVSGIRLSTRPDYINREIVDILKRYTVSAVELGIQSFSDKVLTSCKRGHRAEDSVKAMELLKAEGIPTVGQMMIGLPGSSLEDELHTAEQIARYGAGAARIYPTLVLKETELCCMMEWGEYEPLSIEEAVERSAAVLEVLVDRGVDCLRIGLCDSDNLHSDASYVAGPHHPAIGEMVMGEVYYRRICACLDRLEKLPERLTVAMPVGEISKGIGQNGRNREKLKENYPIKHVKYIENPSLMRYNIMLVF